MKIVEGIGGFIVGMGTCGATFDAECLAAIELCNQIIDGVTYFVTPGSDEGFNPSKILLQQAVGETNGAHINTAIELGSPFLMRARQSCQKVLSCSIKICPLESKKWAEFS